MTGNGASARPYSMKPWPDVIGCHTKEKWAQNFYSHFTHRMRQRRTPAEVVKLCTSCHEDPNKMARHGLESIETYKDTFHWNEVKFGVKNAPDCISCHVPLGYSTHDIRPRTIRFHRFTNAIASRPAATRAACRSVIPRRTAKFASGRVHAYGTKAQMLAGKAVEDFEDLDLDRVLERAEVDLSPEEIFHYKVLQLIKLIYKILIGGTIMFMGFHQWLDFLSAKRKQKNAR